MEKQNSLVSCLVHLNDLLQLWVQGTYFKFIWWNVIRYKIPENCYMIPFMPINPFYAN